MKHFFKTKYRVVKDNYLGYESQYKKWHWPTWRQIGGSNTHATLEEAIDYCNRRGVIWSSECNVSDKHSKP